MRPEHKTTSFVDATFQSCFNDESIDLIDSIDLISESDSFHMCVC